MHKLQFVDGSRDSVWLVEPKMTIGRDAGNDLVLNGPNVTDFHAEIRVDKNNLYLVNLNARNVCKVNGKLVPATAPLQTNDLVQFDQITLRVIDPKQDGKPKTVASSGSDDNWFLEGNASWMTQKTFSLKGTMVIGRDAECQLSFPVSHLSRRHAQVKVCDGYVEVKDLDSTNGTFLNGERITEAKARPGDKIRLDVVQFVLHGPEQKDAAKPFAANVDGDKTVMRRAAPAAATAPASSNGGGAAANKPARSSRPVPNLMTAAAKPAPKLSSAQESGKKGYWPLILGGFVVLVLVLTALFLMR